MPLARTSALAILPLAMMAGCNHTAPRYIDPGALPDAWITRAERTQYSETPRFAETVAFCKRLADTSPYAHYTTFGTSPEGRELPLLILSSGRAFSPQAARRRQKPLILIQNCIHPGECAGKDACLALARDILITGTHAKLLDNVNVLIIPIFNVDGHERFGPYSRINQRGPREMGWRVTANNLNLNRDYTKADAPEMRAWLQLWTAWQPDLLIDTHTTNGGDHGYDLLYAATTSQVVAEPIARWINESLYPAVLPQVEAAGYATFPYSWPIDRSDPARGINAAGAFGARYSTGYGEVCNRPAVLLEAHALKPYDRRVLSTRHFLLHTLELLNRSPERLQQAIRQADRCCAATRGGEHGGQIPLQVERSEEGRPIVYKAYETHLRDSEITGDKVIEYTRTPLDVESTLFDQTRLTSTVSAPAAYLVPPEWTAIIDMLELHGVRFHRLRAARTLDVESYRFEDVRFAERPYESRQIPYFRSVPIDERRSFVAGSVVVPMDQPRAKLAAHLLEPDAPDSLLAWGTLNAIFEQKEYAEAYVMEPIARQMLAEDPELRQEFDNLLANEEDFARSAGRRLDFFYRRSPYWDTKKDVYPVARLKSLETVAALPLE